MPSPIGPIGPQSGYGPLGSNVPGPNAAQAKTDIENIARLLDDMKNNPGKAKQDLKNIAFFVGQLENNRSGLSPQQSMDVTRIIAAFHNLPSNPTQDQIDQFDQLISASLDDFPPS
jgi:hypothetical protein